MPSIMKHFLREFNLFYHHEVLLLFYAEAKMLKEQN